MMPAAGGELTACSLELVSTWSTELGSFDAAPGLELAVAGERP